MKKIIRPKPKSTTLKPKPKPQPPRPPRPQNNILGRGATSVVRYNPTTKIVSKRVTALLNRSIYTRELYWLQYMNKKEYSWCPKLLGSDAPTHTIYMEYVGTPISKANAPTDWVKQLQEILADLKKENIRHNDIKRTELLVKDGKLYLIDYGWASRGNDWSCGQGFNALTKPCHIYHDNTALRRITQSLT